MFTIEIPETIHRISKILVRLGLWTKNVNSSFFENGVKTFYFLYYFIFTISAALGCVLSGDRNERVFLIVFFLDTLVLLYKMAYVIRKNRLIEMLVHETGTHSTNDQKMFNKMKKNLNLLMKFGQIFMTSVAVASTLLTVVFPIANYRRRILSVNVAFPLDKKNEISFWIASLYLGMGIFCATVMIFSTVILWYIMFNFVIEYKLLGSQLRDMGKKRLTTRQQHELYHEDIISAILTYDKINRKLREFVSTFSSLFSLQMATSSLCICGMVYSSAFSSHDDLAKDGAYFIVLLYSFFDIFMITYMGNEIKLSSEGLSYCLFESNWIQQTQSNKKCVLIFGERLRKQQEIVISKVYILNLSTFRSIVNAAYSMFSLLLNVLTT